MARNFGELVLAMLAGCMVACGEDPAGSPSDTDAGSGSDGSTMGPGPGDDADDAEDDVADDADSTGGPAVCGDGVVDAGEVCDDGPDNGTLGRCDANCQGSAVCGDGVVQRDAGEVCDDGDANGAYGSCAADCSGVGARCGDGIVQEEQEGCDDRNEVDGDGCNAGCEIGGQEVTVWTWGDPIEREGARAVGVLPDGRFYAAGWFEEGVPMFAAFEGDDEDPFYEYAAVHSEGGLASASTMPDGRVLVTGDGTNAVSQQNAIRLFIDLDAGEVTNEHIMDAGYNVRSVPLPGGGHILCNNAQFLGLQYFAAGDPDNPVWEDSVNDCHQVTADAARVVKARIDASVPGFYPVVLTSSQHSGFLDWETELSQGSGSHDVGGVAIDSAGNVFVAGAFEAENNPEVELRPLLRKYDPDGELVWAANALFQTVSEWFDVTVDALDNVVVVGYHRITIEDGGDEVEVVRAVVRKYDAAGELLWSWQDDDPLVPRRSELWSVVVAPDGTILAAGLRQVLGEDEDVLFVRLTP